MASITAAGVGSGLDISSIINQLMSVERAPLTALNKRVSSFQSQLSAYGQVKGALSSLQTAAEAIARPEKFAAFKASVADATVLAAALGIGARAGSYSIDVQQLAQSHKLASGGFASKDAAVGTGTFTIALGKIGTGESGASEFIAESGKTLSFELDSGNNSLGAVRDAINAAKIGVTATIINDGSDTPARLVVTSNETGTSNVIKMSGPGGLSFDPLAETNAMEQKVAAQDARLLVDGIPVTRTSNTVTEAIEGVTLTLSKLGSTTLNVQSDSEGIKKNIEAFVKAYNDVNSMIRKQTAYDATAKTAAALNGDSTMRTIMSRLRDIASGEVAGAPGGFARLSEAGISLQSDGSLKIDSAKLDAAMADPTKDLSRLFGDATGSTGIAAALGKEVKSMLGVDGLFSNRTEGINSTIKRLNDRKDALELRMTRVEARFRAQFTALDSMMSGLNTTSVYLSQQLSALSSMNK